MDDHLMDANGDELQAWLKLPEKEIKARTALHIMKIQNRLAEGDESMEVMQEQVDDHEGRITDNESNLGKVKVKSRTRIDTIKLVIFILTFAFMALIGILGLVK